MYLSTGTYYAIDIKNVSYVATGVYYDIDLKKCTNLATGVWRDKIPDLTYVLAAAIYFALFQYIQIYIYIHI